MLGRIAASVIRTPPIQESIEILHDHADRQADSPEWRQLTYPIPGCLHRPLTRPARCVAAAVTPSGRKPAVVVPDEVEPPGRVVQPDQARLIRRQLQLQPRENAREQLLGSFGLPPLPRQDDEVVGIPHQFPQSAEALSQTLSRTERYTFAINGKIAAPCAVPMVGCASTVPSSTPARSHNSRSRGMRRSLIRRRSNTPRMCQLTLSKKLRMSASRTHRLRRSLPARASPRSGPRGL